MRLAVIGTGYVGLVSGACFAEAGHQVVCVDCDVSKVRKLTKGTLPFYEPGLADLVVANVGRKTLSFSTDLNHSARDAHVVFITVGTPSRGEGGTADLIHVHAAARQLAPELAPGAVIAVKSTVPVGGSDAIETIIGEALCGGKCSVVSNPEFLREGSAVRDFMKPDRVVIGCEDSSARKVMQLVYRKLGIKPSNMLFTQRRAAELIKYASNAFLATKITFINEIADLCERVGVDVDQISHGIGLDHRIGREFLRAGPGFGGSCFPKDMTALLSIADDHGVSMRILESVVSVNNRRKRSMARKVAAALGGPIRGSTIAVLGLTFKPNTDDVREAPALTLISGLQDMGARIKLYDPVALPAAAPFLKGVTLCDSSMKAATGADATVIVTEWDEFRTLDLKHLKSVMAAPTIVDLRNIFDQNSMRRRGFNYVSVGRPSQSRAGHGSNGAYRRKGNGAALATTAASGATAADAAKLSGSPGPDLLHTLT